jgi:hypothetical protein
MKFSLNARRILAMAATIFASLNALALTTNNLAASAPADIRDIRGPKEIPSPWLWPVWVTGGIALAALCYGIWRWNRHRSLSAAKLPYEIALDRLEKARELLQPDSAREFSFEVSEIVREYIEARFHVWAARRTTEEFLHDLLDPSDHLLADHRGLLADFLHHCDLAKFARWVLSIEEMETMLQSARTFVIETGKPVITQTTVTQGQSV